jgi:hypothetical protein
MRVVGWGWLALLGACAAGSNPAPRITPVAEVGESCSRQLCGGSVEVRTQLAPDIPLTAEECQAVCASVWCGSEPISGPPGCSLASATTVSCVATVFDCGYPPPYCAFNSCPGCCEPSAVCRYDLGACGGEACSLCSTDRCNLATCRALGRCGARLEAEPKPSTCADADGGIDPAYDPGPACIEACHAADAGAVLDCAAWMAGSCDGEGQQVARCLPDAGVPSSCAQACAATRGSCEAACPRDSFGQCMRCAAGCGLAFAGCVAACGP